MAFILLFYVDCLRSRVVKSERCIETQKPVEPLCVSLCSVFSDDAILVMVSICILSCLLVGEEF